MNAKLVLPRVTALACAVVLFSGYVYERSGGRLTEKLGLRRPAPEPLAADSSAPEPEAANPLPSSNSQTPVASEYTPPRFDPFQDPAYEDKPSFSKPASTNPFVANPSLGKDVKPGKLVLMPGSKSLIIAEPSANPSPTAPLERQLPADSPPEIVPQTHLFPGSKSDILVAPQKPLPKQLPLRSNRDRSSE